MRLEDYNSDTICRAMGMPGFIEESWKQRDLPTLRLLFTPSFSPETCLTLSRQPDGTMLSVSTFVEQFWLQKSPGGLWPCFSEEVLLTETRFDRIARLFADARVESEEVRKGVCLDGMGLEACQISEERVDRLEFHFGRNQIIGEFVGSALEAAWTSCADPHVRNALASCTILGENYPPDKIPEAEPVTRLGIFGSAEEKSEYFEKLRRRS